MCDALCSAVYVARGGSDAAAGTKTAPVATIARGIALAKAASPPRLVAVKAGLYEEQVQMVSGVSVQGSFDDGWRPGTARTEILAASPAVTFVDIAAPTKLSGVVVRSQDATMPGESSVAMVLSNAKMVELAEVEVRPGAGGNGIGGTDGTMGEPGGPAGQGVQGCENDGIGCDDCARPTSGARGLSPCGMNGGYGGQPGHAGNGGDPGAPGDGGALPGAGALGRALNGTEGERGADGLLGSAGVGGAEYGAFSGLRYVVSSGLGGGAGGPGGGSALAVSYTHLTLPTNREG